MTTVTLMFPNYSSYLEELGRRDELLTRLDLGWRDEFANPRDPFPERKFHLVLTSTSLVTRTVVEVLVCCIFTQMVVPVQPEAHRAGLRNLIRARALVEQDLKSQGVESLPGIYAHTPSRIFDDLINYLWQFHKSQDGYALLVPMEETND